MCNEKIDVATVYVVTNRMEMYSEQSRWTRFNAFLVAESIILASWATLYSSTTNVPGILLFLLPFVGMLLGPVWAMLGSRSSKYQKEMHNAAMKLEENSIADSCCIRPYYLIDKIEKEVRDVTRYRKLSSSTWIVTYVPIFFSLMFFIIVVFSAWRACVPQDNPLGP